MKIKGLDLPSSFVEIIRLGNLRREYGCWNLREEIDAYGNPFESELCDIYDSELKIIEETNDLLKYFSSDGFYGEPSEWENEPGFIPDITDFSEIICFGVAGDGAPFCFDYRNKSSESPSIIWWNDAYWRRIAPNFEVFIDLFNLNEET